MWPRLEARAEASRRMRFLSPLLAVGLTLLGGLALFAALGQNPLQGFRVYFLLPLRDLYGLSELLLKATPLMLIGVGLAAGFRAGVWNIGAEGQFSLGALFATAVALHVGDAHAAWAVPAMVLAGALGGALWAAIPAWLRTRWGTNEILVSLMLVYVAQMLASWLIYGPWKDPGGYNFPQTRSFGESALLPILAEGTRLHAGFLLALAALVAGYVFLQRSFLGFQMQVAGQAEQAGRYAGFSARRAIWVGLVAGGALAGVAGMTEVAGPMGQLTAQVSAGYGFAAIIVAFVGRLHPVGIFGASLLMALFFLGGEQAQQHLNLPSSISKVFQGMLLFFLLASDLFIGYRLRWERMAWRGVRMDTSLIASVIAATLVAGTPLIIVAIGELVTERAGVLNLGAEGMMAVGAVAGFAAAHAGANPWLAAAVGMAAGAAMALLFGYLALTLQANQVAAGLALAIFGVGLAAFFGKPYESAPLPAVPPLRIPGLADLPLIGAALFNQQALVYVSWMLVAGTAWFLHRSRAGLVLRAVGESPAAAHAVGYPVIAIRYAAVAFGGAMAGLGGAFLSVFYTPLWSEGMVAGRGWIALALVVFATWRPLRVMLGAYLFGGVLVSQLFVQGAGLRIEIPAQLLSALPYLATIGVLVLISRNPAAIRLNSPASLGRAFRPDR